LISPIEMTKVLLIDDHTLFLDGLELLLRRTGRYEVAGKINDPLQSIDFLNANPVDLVLADIQMPGIDGLDLLKRIQSRFPQIKVVMISMHEEDEFVQEIMGSGGYGFLPKSMDSVRMVEELDKICAGMKIFPKGTRKAAQSEHFSDRELEILRLLAKGKSSFEIAEDLFITLNTVKTHRRNMLRKLNASNTSQLLKIGFDNNLI
jgi:two-component system, NarL family, nitrate/nitrite response regulator NarL